MDVNLRYNSIEHDKLEFTLTIKIRKDPHISRMLNPPPTIVSPVQRSETPPAAKSGMRSFFSSPTKKSSKLKEKEKEKQKERQKETSLPADTRDPFGRWLKKDLTIARSFIAFKDVASRCDSKLFETSFPLIGQCSESASTQLVTKQVGEIVLQLFRLPPISGIPSKELPQSLEECHRGLRHVQWHKITYHEGVLTQLGGDCTVRCHQYDLCYITDSPLKTWRRRTLRVTGANLIAYNDVTKKPIATIDLRQVTSIEDGSNKDRATDMAKGSDGRLDAPKVIRKQSSFNALQGIDHSFRLIFENDEICFFADSEDDKLRWSVFCTLSTICIIKRSFQVRNIRGIDWTNTQQSTLG